MTPSNPTEGQGGRTLELDRTEVVALDEALQTAITAYRKFGPGGGAPTARRATEWLLQKLRNAPAHPTRIDPEPVIEELREWATHHTWHTKRERAMIRKVLLILDRDTRDKEEGSS